MADEKKNCECNRFNRGVLEAGRQDGKEVIKNGEEDKQPLFSIEVYDLSKPPVVKFKGEEIKNKMSINFEWQTETFDESSSIEYEIDYLIKDVDDLPTGKKIYNSRVN